MSRSGWTAAVVAALALLVAGYAFVVAPGASPPGAASHDDSAAAPAPAAVSRRAAAATAAAADGLASGRAPDEDGAPPAIHALRGSVRTWDGRLLGGAVVRAEPVPVLPHAPELRQPSEATADAQGAFDVPKLAAGDWALLVSAEGALRTYVATVRVPENERFDLVLPRGSVIAGTVIDETTRAGVGGARVRVEGYAGWIADATTTADGRFRVPLYERATKSPFRIDAPGYARGPAKSSEFAIDETVLGIHDVVLVVERGHTLTGRVVGPDGPLAGARVIVDESGARDDPDAMSQATTDVAGRFAIEHLLPDSYWLRAEADGFVMEGETDPDVARPGDSFDTHVDTAADGWTAADIVMRRRAPIGRCTIEGHVLAGESQPVAGVTVRTNQRSGVNTTSAADGGFVLKDVPTEAADCGVEVVGEREGLNLSSVGVETSAGAHVTGVELFVEAPEEEAEGPHARGCVRAPDGTPVAGARVVVVSFEEEAYCSWGHQDPPGGVSTRTSSDGRFDVEFSTGTRAGQSVAIVVEAAGFARWRTDFSLRADDEYGRRKLPDDLQVSLVTPSPLVGRVVRAGTETGIAGARVAAARRAWHDWRETALVPAWYESRFVATTAADGTFRLAEFDREHERLRVFGEGWVETEIFPSDLEEFDPSHLLVELQPALELSGRVEFEGARPCAGVSVRVLPELDPPPPDPPDWVPDPPPAIGGGEDGSFRCTGLAPGRHRLEFSGGTPQCVPLVAGPFEAGSTSLRVELRLGRTIRGRVLLPNADPAKRQIVKAVRASGDRAEVGEASTNSAGEFAVGGLAGDEYTLSCAVEGFLPWQRAEVRADGEPFDIDLDEGLAVGGVLQRPDGSDMYLTNLLVEPAEADHPTEPRRGATDSNGRFRVAALTPGRWRIRLSSEDSLDELPETIVAAGSEALVLKMVPRPPKPSDAEPPPDDR